MPKKTVIRADLIGTKCKAEILPTVAKIHGIKSMAIDPEKCTLTVVGDLDPVCIVHALKKACFAATIVSVEDEKPKDQKKPCQEACEKACKELCERACSPGCYYNPCLLPNCYYYSHYSSACRPVTWGGSYEDTSSGQCSIQ